MSVAGNDDSLSMVLTGLRQHTELDSANISKPIGFKTLVSISYNDNTS